MLKKFFTVFLGSMAAIWFSILLLIGVTIVSVAVWLSHLNSNSISKHSILHIVLNGEITDRRTPPSVKDVVLGEDIESITFDEITRALKIAKTDSDIEGVYLDLRGSGMGLAMRQELGKALADFKTTGKWIIAYAESCNQGDYLTATSANQLYINPSGDLYVSGLSASVPYFKNALDKLGVDVQVIKVGTFKSAVEPFILTTMSDSARYQYDVMLGTMWDSYVSEITANLGRDQTFDSTFRKMAETPMMAFNANQLVEAKLFDATKYEYQIHELLKTKAKSGKELNLVNPRDYLGSFNKSFFETENNSIERDHIAVLYAVGDIVDSGSDGIVGQEMAPLIIRLAENDHVKGLLLRINSGGGSAFASEQIWASLEYFKSTGKPFVVSMGSVAASGGYYIACGADKIFADPSTITGSIGIFGVIPYAQKLLNDKLGINISTVETNPNAIFPNIDRPLTPAQHEALEKYVHEGYDLFVNRVATGRRMEDVAVRRIAEGRVWAGSMALEIGLVDEMGGLEDAMAFISDKTGLSPDKAVAYPQYGISPLDLMLSQASGSAIFNNPLEKLGLTKEQIDQATNILSRIKSMNVIQAKMEDIRVE